MAKYMYSDADIKELYEGARDKKMQIIILSQLCLVSYNEMLDKLVELQLMTNSERARLREPEPVEPINPEIISSKKQGRVAQYAPYYYMRGYTDIEIARLIGCTHQTVAEWRRREDLPRNVKYRRHLAQIKRMLAAGESYTAIHKATGVDRRITKRIESGEIQ